MILFLAYLLIAIAIISILLAIYNIYCLISLRIFKKKVKESTDSSISDYKSKFNLFIWLIKKSKKVKRATSPNELQKAVKKKIKTFTFVILVLILSNISSALKFTVYGVTVYTLNQQITTVSAMFNTLFGKDKDCPCYALCTGDPSDDALSVYELIFGYEEYNNLIELMDLTDAEYEEFYGVGRYGETLETMEDDPSYLKGSIKIINSSNDGRLKSEFIRDHINDDMVNAYRALVLERTSFRSADSVDRRSMELEDFRDDLYNLLSDYKVNGRNPNCEECRNANKLGLSLVCSGEKHWKEGWHWDPIYYDENYKGESPSTPSIPNNYVMGHATGIYAIQLDDGMYYWYHQGGKTGCGCQPYCGDWSMALWGWKDQHKFGQDGCAVYSLAIGLSNLCGMEITPDVIFSDLGGGNSGGVITTTSDYFSGTGRSMKRSPVVTTLANKYGLTLTSFEYVRGKETEAIEFIDGILSQGGIVWGSWDDNLIDWCSGQNSHFMCIRKMDGIGYYCFTSCHGRDTSNGGKQGAIDTMNHGIDKHAVVGAFVDKQTLYGFVNPNAGSFGGGKVSFYGDSISTFQGITEHGKFSKYYPAGDVTSADQTWWMQVVNGGGYTFASNSSHSGCRTAKAGKFGYSGTDSDRLDALDSNSDVVYVFLGTNDLWNPTYSNDIGASASDFKNDYKTMLQRVKARCPNAQIVCLTLYKSTIVTEASSAEMRSSGLDEYNSAIKDAAASEGAAVIDLSSIDMTSDEYRLDGVHPNAAGMTKIAETVLAGGSFGGGGGGTVLKDEEIYSKLVAGGFSEANAKAVAIIYSTIKPVYGSQAALALAACSLCEGSPGKFENLSSYMEGKKLGGVVANYTALYKMANDTSKQDYIDATAIFKRLGGNIIKSQQEAIDWKWACSILASYPEPAGHKDEGMGIGFIQFSGGRRTPRLDAYSHATDFSEDAKWAYEMEACLNEVAGSNTYKNAFTSAQNAGDYKTAVDKMASIYIGVPGSGLALREAKMELINNALGGTKFD